MMKYACLLAFLATSACAPSIDDVSDQVEGAPDEQIIDPNELCDAAEYRPLIGTQVTDTSFPTGKLLRVYSDSDIVTQEYIPQRTNVVYGVSGAILQVTCG